MSLIVDYYKPEKNQKRLLHKYSEKLMILYMNL